MPEIRREGNRIIIDLDANEKLVIADEQLAVDAKVQFRSLPQWATWSPQEARDYVHSNILDGMETAAINGWIDANVTSIATARTALKQLAAAIINTRTILKSIAMAVIFFRQIVVRRS